MKVHFLTGKRGGFGAMVPTLRELQRFAEVTVLTTDQHHSETFGYTLREVAAESLSVIGLPMVAGSSRPERLAYLGMKLASLWAGNRPDVLLLIGDRGESLVAATIAQQMGNIAIAHVEGGDVTGCLDDSARHAISKLAHVHFCTDATAKARLIGMGEAPWRIHAVGDVHIDRLMLELQKPLVPDERFADAVVVLHHPDTLHPERIRPEIRSIIDMTAGQKRLFIYPCSDLGHEIIIREIEQAARDGLSRCLPNVAHAEFINGLRQARLFVGNSSSLVKEAPYIGVPVHPVGDRQNGRPIGKRYGDGTAYRKIVHALMSEVPSLAKRWAA